MMPDVRQSVLARPCLPAALHGFQATPHSKLELGAGRDNRVLDIQHASAEVVMVPVSAFDEESQDVCCVLLQWLMFAVLG